MEIKAPDMGVESAEVAEILVKVGDVIEINDSLILAESDKASVEVPAPVAGRVTAILVNVGDHISEGSSLVSVEAADGDEQADAHLQDEQVSPEPKTSDEVKSEQAVSPNTDGLSSGDEQTHHLPDLGVDSAEVSEVLVNVGDEVAEGQSLLLVESDKASVEVPAPTKGVVAAILVNAGDTVTNGQAFIVIKGAATQDKPQEKPQDTKTPTKPQTKEASQTKAPEASASAPAQTPTKLPEEQVNARAKNAHAGPAVRKLARELGVDISAVKGTAVHGRILKEDLFGYVKSVMTQQAAPSKPTNATTGAAVSLPPLPDMSNQEIWGEIEVQDLTRLQKVSIPQLNLNTLLPQVTQFDLADITDTENLRNEIKAEFKAQGVSLTILAFIVKATAYALTQHPKFNSHVSDDNTQFIVRKSVNMGIAVATDEGLIVPVIKNAQDKGIRQLAIEIGELAKKARDKKLAAKDLQGASFTISSQGNMGGTYFTPLVNHPQVAILGISESTYQPRWNGKEFEPRLMLPLSLSYDHRLINGADAAVFTRYVAKLLADPRKILL